MEPSFGGLFTRPSNLENVKIETGRDPIMVKKAKRGT
jgi:hypothetical protein